MPRERARGAVAVAEPETTAPPSVVAAARRVTGKPDLVKVSRTGRGWQDRAWEFFDTVGELRYGADWVGNMLSKATLYLAYDREPVVDQDRLESIPYVGSLFGGPEGQVGMLADCGQHLTVAGECYLVGLDTAFGETWMVVAATELTSRGGKWYVDGKQLKSTGEPFILRLWRPHPRKPSEANAPTRAVLNVLGEIDALTKRISAEIDSRLAGAGVFFVPQEFTLPTRQVATADGGTAPDQSDADDFQDQLTEAMTEAIGDRESAAALVPIVVTVPGDRIEQVKHITFWSPLDEHSIELRNEAIRRLALGLDLPPEVITGTADLNHWAAWAVDEAAIKAHAEPLLQLITASLTTGFLRPLLVDDGMDPAEAERYSIMADTSMLRLRPNRSKEAFELYDRGEIDGVALRREVGFDEADKPSDEEERSRLLRKLASGQTTPEIVEAALRVLGVLPATAVAPRAPVQARPTPSLAEHPVTGPPELPAQVSSAAGDLLAAADVIVVRALERAGNRLKNRTGSRLDCRACDLYQHVPVTTGMLDHLLEDAFTDLERYVACRAVDVAAMGAALDTYCRALLTTARPHDPQLLDTYLSNALTMAVAS